MPQRLQAVLPAPTPSLAQGGWGPQAGTTGWDGAASRAASPGAWSAGPHVWARERGLGFLLQGIFLTQGLDLGLPHCWQTLYGLSHQGIPKKVYMCPQVGQCLDAYHIEVLSKGNCDSREKTTNWGNSVRKPLSFTFILSLPTAMCAIRHRRGRRNFRSHFPLSSEAC